LLIPRSVCVVISPFSGWSALTWPVPLISEPAPTALGGAQVSYWLQSDGTFRPDNGTAALSSSALRALAATPGQEITYTCLPPGWEPSGA